MARRARPREMGELDGGAGRASGHQAARRILFVDDEPAVLEGLRALFRVQRGSWELGFASGGTAALDELTRSTFDVVVSDVRMPGMDGVELLDRVRSRYPSIVRIVLSGYTDAESMLELSHLAHQCIAKPCDFEALRSAIERCRGRACAHGDCLHACYLETFWKVRGALANVDAGALGRLRVEIVRRAERDACLLAFDDAVQGRPPRSRVHFCRAHASGDRLVRDEA